MALSFSVILIVIIILILWWYLRNANRFGKIKIFFWLVVLVLLYLSITNVFLAEPIDFTSPKSIIHAVGVYFQWIGQTLLNLWDVGAETTGNVVKAVNHTVTG